jgi:hypothetical protein
MILNIVLVSKNNQTFVNFFKVFNTFFQKNQMLNASLISQKKKKKKKKKKGFLSFKIAARK